MSPISFAWVTNSFGEIDSSAPGSEAAGAVNDAVPDDKPFDVSWIAGKTLLNREDGSTVETRITGIASNDRGRLMLNVAGQSKPVSADKISYADYGDAILYQTINTMDITPGAARIILILNALIFIFSPQFCVQFGYFFIVAVLDTFVNRQKEKS